MYKLISFNFILKQLTGEFKNIIQFHLNLI
jgi:hypothetical protein